MRRRRSNRTGARRRRRRGGSPSSATRRRRTCRRAGRRSARARARQRRARSRARRAFHPRGASGQYRRPGMGWVRATRGVVPLLVVAVLAGCGSGSEDAGGGVAAVQAQLKGLTGKARLDKLAQLAKQEGGKLSLYGSLNTDDMGELI